MCGITVQASRTRKLFGVAALMLCLFLTAASVFAIGPYRTIQNPFTSRPDYVNTGNFSSENLTADHFFYTNGTELVPGSGGGAGGGSGYTEWTVSNGSTTSSVINNTRVNLTAGRNVTITQVGSQLVINAIDTDTDTDTTYTNGSGLSLIGTQFNHTDTSSQSSSDNSGRTYIQDIILDTFGHITSIVTAAETVTDTDTNNYTDTCSVSGSGTKTATCSRNNWNNYSWSWTDLDTDTNSAGNMSVFFINASLNQTMLYNNSKLNLINDTGILYTLVQDGINTNLTIKNTGMIYWGFKIDNVQQQQVDSTETVDFRSGDGISLASSGSATAGIATFNIACSELIEASNDHLQCSGQDLQVADDFLLNTGDTGSGNYTFDTRTLHIDSTNDKIGVGTINPVQTFEVNGSANITGGTFINATSCDSVDTDARGMLICGSDATGGGAGGSGNMSIWRLQVGGQNSFSLYNNSLLRLLSGTGISITNDTEGNITITNTGDTNSADDLTITQVTSANGNWSADKSLYATLAYVNTLGNWSADKSSYATTAFVNTLGNFSRNATSWEVCNSGDYSRWNGSGFKCFTDQDTGGGASDSGTMKPQRTFSLSAEAAEQVYTYNTSCDYINIKARIRESTSTSAGGLGIRINSVGGTAYKGQYMKFSTNINYNNENAWRLNDASTGASNFVCDLTVQQVEVNSEMTGITGTCKSSNEDVFLGGSIDAGGNVANITFDDYDSDATFTGQIDIYCFE